MYFIDIECYPNYFLMVYTSDGETYHRTSDRDEISKMLKQQTVGFNSLRYDIPMMRYYASGADEAECHAMSCEIINGDMRPVIHKRHIDLWDVAPGVQIGLKLYGGRMHTRTIQDLPFDPMVPLTDEQKQTVSDYCVNDVRVLWELYQRLLQQIKLRRHMSREYGRDMMSKSDAQMAEVVMLSQLPSTSRPKIQTGRTYRYRVPDWMWYETAELQQLLNGVKSSRFVINKKGDITIPDALKTTVKIGDSVYRLGIGGLHSSETTVSHYAGERHIIDCDVASYYPSIIINSQLYPPQFGEHFLDVYQTIVTRRLVAKRSGDTVTADSLKITINGGFGKLNSKYSTLYAPELFFHVTVTGQLALLMLIEQLELAHIPVVSGNTDGIVTMPTDAQLPTLRAIIALWEAETGYVMEETHYRSIHSRDVNNYVAVKTDGSAKSKGVYAKGGLMKNPQMEIIGEAVTEHLCSGVPVEQTISRCTDITKFVTVRTVKGGGVWRGDYLGKVVRWYWSTNGEPITYRSNGNKVATSDGAKPAMTLPETFPGDVDRQRYIDAALDALKLLGVQL